MVIKILSSMFGYNPNFGLQLASLPTYRTSRLGVIGESEGAFVKTDFVVQMLATRKFLEFVVMSKTANILVSIGTMNQ